jgi:protein-S-isoprenylcysteine O-methyltransferase Ste14
MKPYFDTNHLAGLLLLIVIAGWTAMEIAQGRNKRDGAVKVGGAGGRFLLWPGLIAGNVVLYLAPRLAPGATIRPGGIAFGAGLAALLAGVGLRGWSFTTLGQYFTFTVMVSADQPVVTAGPYRVLRHPSYLGVLLGVAGIGLASANWVGLAGMVLLPLAVIVWRIHAEEAALLATLGDRYRSYAARHKRLIPLVW